MIHPEESRVCETFDDPGIWQFGGLPQDAQDALAKTGWIDEKAEDSAPTSTEFPNLNFDRADIEAIVERAVADEVFADERSKEVPLPFPTTSVPHAHAATLAQMFTDETREKLLKAIVRREVREEQGVELEDLLNPIKVRSIPLHFASFRSAPPVPGNWLTCRRRRRHRIRSLRTVSSSSYGGPPSLSSALRRRADRFRSDWLLDRF